MEISPLLFLGFLWFLFNLLRGTKTESGQKPRRPPPRPQPPKPSGPPSRRQQPLSVSTSLDPTQNEGSRLEALLRDLNRSLEQVGQAGTVDHAGRAEPDDGEEIEEERESLETTPETVSLETPYRRPARKTVDYDEAANQLAAKRLAAVQARSGPQTVAGHRQFDERIRQEPADHTAVKRRYTGQQLRDAVVWREILGPPTALRDQDKP